MLMIVSGAFVGAEIADRRAGLEHHPQGVDVLPGASYGKPRSCRADIGAVKTRADALAHVHRLGHAGVGTAGAHFGTEHGMARSRRERLIKVVTHIRVKRNHLVDRHGSITFLAAGFPAFPGGGGTLFGALAGPVFVTAFAQTLVVPGLTAARTRFLAATRLLVHRCPGATFRFILLHAALLHTLSRYARPCASACRYSWTCHREAWLFSFLLKAARSSPLAFSRICRCLALRLSPARLM